MKKLLFISILLLMVFFTGCTADDPGYAEVTNIGIDSRGHVITADVLLNETVEGRTFLFRGAIDDLDSAHSFDILIKTGGLPVFIAELSIQTDGAAHGYFYENTVVSANGNALTPICTNRILKTPTVAEFYGGSTETNNMVITSVGTQLMETILIANVARNINDASTVGAPLVLAPNTNYLIRIDNLEVGDIIVDYDFSFVETE